MPTSLGTATLGVMAAALIGGQSGSAEKPLMAENVFKNVQVLKGIPVDQFLGTMGFFSASLGMTCTDCHVPESGGSWEKYSVDTELKRTTRKMLAMVSALNRTYFAGQREVTCYSCHRGADRPRVTPSLIELYSAPAPAEPPDSIAQGSEMRPAAPILDKYIEALGGRQRLVNLTSFVAKGTYVGFGETDKTSLELFAKAPDQRTTIVHTPIGDNITVYNGRAGWTATPGANTPVPVLELSSGELEGAKLDADLSFPARIKQAFPQWRAAAPATIDGHQVQIVQGTSDGRYPVDFYFDRKSGLLVRVVRYSDSPVGLSPTQIDYADYREVAGMKMPFRWTVTWLSGRSTIELTVVQPNIPIDAAKFAKPNSSAR